MENTFALSVVILTRNEEENIEECIKSIDGLEVDYELLVIDDESTDQTTAIAEKYGAIVLIHPLNNDFSQQRNWALTKTSGEWVFFLDADERCSKELIGEIDQLVQNKQSTRGAYFKRHDYFGGKLLKHGEIGSIRLLRLAQKDSGVWKGTVDEVWDVKGKLITLNQPLLHYSHPNLTQFLESVNHRSGLNAQQLYDSGIRVRWFDWGKPIAKFIHNYILRLGFLDGLPGFVFAVLMSFHSFLVRGKLYLLWKRT